MKNTQRQSIEDVEVLLLSNLQQKPKTQIIHQSPNLNVLKNIFARSKKKFPNQTHNQSLLFDRNSSISMLKAYRNRKKILLQESIHKQHDENITKSYHHSTPDSPQKMNFLLESVKYDFEKSSKRKQYYKQLLKMIEEAQCFQKIKFQKDQQKKNNFNNENQTKTINNDFLQQKQLIKSLTLVKRQISTLSPNKFHSSTLSPRQNKKQLFRIRNIKSSNEGFLENKMMKLTQSQGKFIMNPEKEVDEKKRYGFKGSQRTGQNSRMKKEISKIQNQLSLPQIKASRQSRSLFSPQNRNHQKGYMFFHPEAKLFIKENRQLLNTDPKIPSLMISGITATSFFVIDIETMTPITYRNFNKRIQIASISKVMTCYLSLLACKKYDIDLKKYVVRVSREASEMNGTSAQLEYGDCLTLQEALYGLMLPSGNDASYAIAETIGKLIQRHKTKQTKKSYYETFIAHMNLLSREFKLQQEWKNSSGLSSNPNHSTPQAISLLTIAVMMDQKFRNIVSCKEFEVTIKNQKTGLKKIIKWKNTNKLLNEGWQGVKTGTTESAGHCLIAKKDRYLIGVFNSSTLSKRFTQCSTLYSLVKSKQRYLFFEKWD